MDDVHASEGGDSDLRAINEHGLQYAMSWFTYHAEQRYQAVLIYVIQLLLAPVAAVSAAFLAAGGRIEGVNNLLLGLLILAFGIVGMLVTTAFWLLDDRNFELVKVGESALKFHERSLPVSARILWLKERAYSRKTHKIVKHSFLLKFFFGLGGFLYLMVAILSLFYLIGLTR